MPATAARLSHFTESVIRAMTRLSNQHGAINLSQGFPDFAPPARLLERVTHHMAAGANQYPPMAGVPALREAIAECEQDAGIRAVVLTGNGRAFCAGEDLKETVARGTVERQPTRLPDLYRLGKLDKPVIAAVNGTR
jgi:1,4-dihydroxy-2-naphthoyl-CoA synthase